MRITKISVKKLFGVFDHEIPLNQESRITIIHGPNGYGKTILLTMLNGLFSSDYRVFREVPFEEFHVHIDYHERLVLRKDIDQLELSLTNATGKFASNLPPRNDGDLEWLSQIERNLSVELIRTQRLQTEAAIEAEAISVDSSVLAGRRGLAVEEYSAKAARLVHDTLGARRISKSQITEVNGILDDLTKLLRNDNSSDNIEASEIENKFEYVRSLIDTVTRRTTNVKETGKRLTMLVELLNGHFSFKTVFTDAKSGLVILGQDENLIPVSMLSSGEQHQLVLFSKLLFDLPFNSLVLIDEPELSLHVTWQRDFLNDLTRIIELCDFDVLIATHSPQIVSGREDLTVPLKNPDVGAS